MTQDMIERKRVKDVTEKINIVKHIKVQTGPRNQVHVKLEKKSII